MVNRIFMDNSIPPSKKKNLLAAAACLCLAIHAAVSEPVANFTLESDFFDSMDLEVELVQPAPLDMDYADSTYILPPPKHKSTGLLGIRQPATLKYIRHYMTETKREHIAEALYRARDYRPYIVASLRKNRMPLWLQYLPLVESDYTPNAVSVSGATGLWQFMENSMEPFMKKSEWYDERLDPWKETDAAIKKLQDNYRMFGDWTMAVAAYNMGAGALMKITKANPSKDYWQLCRENLLPEQTVQYIPKLCALAELCENAEYYGLIEFGIQNEFVRDRKPEKYSYLKVKGSISLEKIARASELDEETLEFLNPALMKKITPPDEVWLLRLPAGYAKKIAKSISG